MRRGWLAYAAALTGVVLLSEIADLAHGKPLSVETLANWLVTAALLLATWCYGLQKPLRTEGHWRLAFWVVVGITALELVRVVLAGPLGVYVAVVSLVLVAPAFVAAYRYAYRSSRLWSTRPSDA